MFVRVVVSVAVREARALGLGQRHPHAVTGGEVGLPVDVADLDALAEGLPNQGEKRERVVGCDEDHAGSRANLRACPEDRAVADRAGDDQGVQRGQPVSWHPQPWVPGSVRGRSWGMVCLPRRRTPHEREKPV